MERIAGIRSGWAVVAASVVGIAFSSGTIAFYALSALIQPISAERGWSTSTIVFGATVFALVQVVAVPAGGQLLDRVGVRRVLLPAMVLFGLSVMGIALVQTPLGFYLGFALMGIVGGGISSLIFIRAICSWFDENRGLAIGVAASGMGVALMLIPPLSGFLLTIGSWRLVYVVLGAIVLLVALPCAALFVHERPGSVARTDQLRTSLDRPITGLDQRQALRDRRFWLLMAMFFLQSGVVSSTAIHIVSLARQEGFNALALTAASVFGGSMVVGRLTAGVLIDRFACHYIAAIMIGLVSAATFSLMVHPSGAVLILCAAVIGIGAGSDGDLMAYMVARYFGLRAFGALAGYSYGIYILAASLFPYLVGLSFDRTGSYVQACTIGGFMTASAAVMALMMGRASQEYAAVRVLA